jgi:N-methylhydantoinase B
MAIDPITIEVLRSALPAITNEMSYVLRRTSYNMMIYEVGDYCCSVLDTEGNLISQNAGGVSHFVSDLGVVIRDGVQRIKDFAPGDVIITNHQAVCGQHLNNICVYTPFFFEGALLGFAVIRAHWIDVGGYSTGFGAGAAASDPWLEGLQLNQLKIYKAGKPDEGLLQMISDNIRQPESSMGDLRAQMASCNLGVKRLEEICTKYGKDVVFEAIAQIFTESEARCRKVIAEFEDGTFEYEAFFDDSASKVDGPIRIKTIVTVAGDQMTIDLSQCSKQRNSVLNSRTLAGPYIAFKALTCPLEPVNEGSFKALDVILPEGTFMMAHYPAPMAGWSVALPTVVDAILAALAPSQPTRMPAAHKGVMGDSITFFGDNPKTGRRFVVQSIEGGGWGGRPYEDGPSASVTVCQGDVRNSPIEALEQRFPIIVEKRGFREDSGGAGKFRGGLGLDVRVRNLVGGRWNLAQTGRKAFPPWGLWGGKLGGRGDRKLQLPGETDWTIVDAVWHQVPAETRAVIQSAGGGGWGEPLERELESVRQDVLRGMVSAAGAERDYGVVLNVVQSHGATIDVQVDFAATKKIRQDRSRLAAAAAQTA